MARLVLVHGAWRGRGAGAGHGPVRDAGHGVAALDMPGAGDDPAPIEGATLDAYIISIGMFVAGSALAGAAWSAESLIAFRVLQGFGGGMIMPAGMTILTRARRGRGRRRG